MTIARPSDATSSAATPGAIIQWMSVQKGLWVGKVGGEFAGMIEARGDGFAAVRLSELLGVFPTLADAKSAFAR